MKLRSYRQLIGTSVSAAALANRATPRAWRHWESETRSPDSENVKSIFFWSNGAVEPNDLHPMDDWRRELHDRKNNSAA